MPTQAEIKENTDKHADNIARLRAELEGKIGVERAQIKYWQGFCKHPNGFETSCMGDRGFHCPDCGYST